MGYFLDQAVFITGSVVPAANISIGAGELLCYVIKGAGAGGSFTVTSEAEVDALVASTDITSAGGDFIKVALRQTVRGSLVRVRTYSTTAVDTAIAAANAEATWDVAVSAFFGINDVSADIADIVDAAEAAGQSKLFLVESPNTALKTGSFPSGLADLQLPNVRVFYVTAATDATTGVAAGAGSYMAYKQLIGAGGGPVAGRVRIIGPNPPSTTGAEATYLDANGAGLLMAYDVGSSASTRLVYGEMMFDGETPVNAAVTLLYAMKRTRALVGNLILQRAILGSPILNTIGGQTLVASAVEGALAPMVLAGHFVISDELPNGYSIETAISGTSIVVNVRLQIGSEIHTFSIPFVAEVV